MDGFNWNYDIEVAADEYEEYRQWLVNGGYEEMAKS